MASRNRDEKKPPTNTTPTEGEEELTATEPDATTTSTQPPSADVTTNPRIKNN